MSRVNGFWRSTGNAALHQPDVLEGYVLYSYPDWQRWTLRMRVAVAMLDRYADADAALAGEGIDQADSGTGGGVVAPDAWSSFVSAVLGFYSRGRHHPPFPRNKKDRDWHVLSEEQLMRAINHDRLMAALRSYNLGEATSDEVRMLKLGGWFDKPPRRRSSTSPPPKRAAVGGGTSSGKPKSNGADLRNAWPSTRDVL